MNKGFLITVEGPDGAGKTTQIEMLKSHPECEGWVFTRNPGGTKLGTEIRHLLLDAHDVKVAPIAELLLYMADRAQHYKEVIEPALKEGKVVVCDRYIDSTVAYQGYARGLDIETINHLNKLVTYNNAPDLTVLLDVSPEIGLKRAGGKDKIEAEGQSFQELVRNGLLELARLNSQRFQIIQTDNISTDEVHEKILKLINCLVLSQKVNVL
jgi:dTMP kinase